MKISLIAAVSSNGVVGRDGKLPWHLPEDLKYFKRVTLGKPVVMGRRTWESIGRPLPGRTNIVVSAQPGYTAEGASVVAGLEEALQLAERMSGADDGDEIMVIGGAEIYRLAFPGAQRLYITEVHADVTGDAFFPAWDRHDWREVSREGRFSPAEGGHDFSFVVYDRG